MLLIQFFLFPVSFPEADNAKFILLWSDNDGVQATLQESQNTQAQLSVVATRILHDECGLPIEFGCKHKGQVALSYVLRVLGGVEGETHLIYCYSNNYTLPGVEVASSVVSDTCGKASPLFARKTVFSMRLISSALAPLV